MGRKHLIWIAALLFFCVYIRSGVYTYLQRRAEIQRILQASANLGAQREPLREKLDMLREQECVIDGQILAAATGKTIDRPGKGASQLMHEHELEQTRTELRAVEAQYDVLSAHVRTLPDAPKSVIDPHLSRP